MASSEFGSKENEPEALGSATAALLIDRNISGDSADPTRKLC